jgi:putative isomerase
LDRPVGICTGHPRSLDEIRACIAAGVRTRDSGLERYGPQRELAGAMASALGWTTVHNAVEDRLTTVCSRVWASRNAGSLLFCWDTFLAAMMAAALGEPRCARAYCDAIVDTIDLNGYVPNIHTAIGAESLGQSQPPVGSMAIRYCAQTLGDAAFGEPYLDRLLTWSRFWPERRDIDGFLCWGSNRMPPRLGTWYETLPGNLQGARFESGLDNSPMYDDAGYDEKRGIMLLADVGLMSFYIRDCLDLAYLCQQAGRTHDAGELRGRASKYAAKLEELWNEPRGIYLNRDLRTGQPSLRRSPTLFYPLLTGLVSPERAEKMIARHLLDPQAFWGEYVLPSISRDDPAYADQNYWRGRIWAPMNFLVYLGLKEAGRNNIASQLAGKSASLFLKAWQSRGYIGENYNANTGDTGEKVNSDPFNPWGALLAFSALMDTGAVAPLPRVL